jgi:hypothetical protein
MRDVARGLIYLMLTFVIGIIVGAYLQMSLRSGVEVVTETIILTVPKNDKEMEKQLLYLSASKGMLEELHRQGVLKKK